MYNKKIKKQNFKYKLHITLSIAIGLITFVSLTALLNYIFKIHILVYLKYFNFSFLNIELFSIYNYKIKLSYTLLAFAGIASAITSFLLKRNKYTHETLNDYGSSRFATGQDLKHFNPSITDNKGMTLGLFKDNLLQMNQTLSGLVVAPAGSGKSVSVIIPNILSCKEDSLIINDPKGELYEETSKVRKLYGNVYRFEWDNPEVSNKWNMLDIENLPKSQAERERLAKVIADTIIGSESGGDGKFWEQSAKDLLFASILFNIYKEELNDNSTSLPLVADFLATLGNNEEPYLVEELEISEDEENRLDTLEGEMKVFLAHAFFARANNFPKTVFTMFSQNASQDQKTLANIKASIAPKTSIFMESSVRETTSSNDFNFSQLRGEKDKNGNLKPISVYFIVPALDQEIYGVLSALFVDLATRYLGKKMPSKTDKAVRFILDEVAFFPPLPNIINAPAIMRGYRVCYIYACQDFAQIEEKWKNAGLEKLLTNTAWKIVLGQNNPKTVKMLQDMLGKTTRDKKQSSSYNNKGVGSSKNFLDDMSQAVDGLIAGKSTNNKQKEGVELFEASKFGSLKMGEQILLVQNSMNRPVFCQTAFYLNVKEFRKQFRELRRLEKQAK